MLCAEYGYVFVMFRRKVCIKGKCNKYPKNDTNKRKHSFSAALNMLNLQRILFQSVHNNLTFGTMGLNNIQDHTILVMSSCLTKSET